jgi:hypothetical protein
LDYQRGLPIVMLTLEVTWDPQQYYGDHGATLIEPMESTFVARQSATEDQPGTSIDQPGTSTGSSMEYPKLSTWHHSESYSIFHPESEPDDGFHDAQPGSDKEFLGRVFHLDIPKHWQHYKDPPPVHFDEETWYDSQSNKIRGDTATMSSRPSAALQTATSSCSDWDLNLAANHHATATANWASAKQQFSNEDLEKMRPWMTWIPVENIQKTLNNTTLAKAVANYPMFRHLSSRFKLLNRFKLREIVFTDTIFPIVRAVGGGKMRAGTLWPHISPYGRVWNGKQESISRHLLGIHKRSGSTIWFTS